MIIKAQEILDQINAGVDKLPVYGTRDYEFPSLRQLSIEYNRAKETLALGMKQLKFLAGVNNGNA